MTIKQFYPDFYYRREVQEYTFMDSTLTLKSKITNISIISFEGEYEPKDFVVLEVLKYEKYDVIFVNWKLDRNILCFDRSSNQIVWRIPKVKQIWSTSPNAWCRIHFKDEAPGVIYCRSVERYSAGFKIETGEMVYEYIPDEADPRDM